jgi:hypothetical protein
MLTAEVVAQVTTTADEAQGRPSFQTPSKAIRPGAAPQRSGRIGWMRWRTAHGYRTDVEARRPRVAKSVKGVAGQANKVRPEFEVGPSVQRSSQSPSAAVIVCCRPRRQHHQRKLLCNVCLPAVILVPEIFSRSP